MTWNDVCVRDRSENPFLSASVKKIVADSPTGAATDTPRNYLQPSCFDTCLRIQNSS